MTELTPLESLKLSRKPSPLSLYLTIYSKANRECYINYMEGAKLLKDWLGEIELPLDKYPDIGNSNFTVPNLLCGYESNELAKILCGYHDTYDMSAWDTMSAAIYFVMSNEVILGVT